MSQINPKQGLNQTTVGVSHTRSMSQPPLFGNPGLPPLSPYPPSESSNSNFKNLPMEEMDVSSLVSPAALPSPRENPFRGNNAGLPPRKGHRRSNSDVALGFSAMIQSSPQLMPISSQEASGRAINTPPPKTRDLGEIKPEGEAVNELLASLMNMDALNGSGGDGKDKDSISSSSKMSGGDGSSDSENATRHCAISRERGKRSAVEDIVPLYRHTRSLSMDSGIGKFLFSDMSPSNSLNENLARVSLDVGHGGFSEAELKKISADERLAGIAMSDPKKVKRILANRQSAARSKERKLRYISELEHKVQTLQMEATTLSAQFTTLQKDYSELINQNNELQLRIQAAEQQARLRDALHETLLGEVQRLKLANMEFREDGQSARYAAHMKHQMLSTQEQMQQLSVTSSKSSTTTCAVSERVM